MSEENMHFSISIPNILPVELIRTDFYWLFISFTLIQNNQLL